MQSNYPILEFDPAPEAIIEPGELIRPMDVPEQCVICFFQQVIATVVKEHNAKVIASLRWEDAGHPIYEIEMDGRRVAFASRRGRTDGGGHPGRNDCARI